MTFEKQVKNLLASDTVEFRFRNMDHEIPVRFKSGPSGCKTLLILFHGAIDRVSREVPAFVPFIPELDSVTHQLAVSDPTMLTGSNFSMSWYAGHDGFPSQKILRELFDAICVALNIERTIYFGTSGGGFAALYYSWHHPDSVAIVGNPQTKITDYYPRHVENYRSSCWSETAEANELLQCVTGDVRQLYADQVPNFVVYVQSSTDSFHIKNHMVPFFSAVPYKKDMRIILNVGFFGKFGHSPSFEAYAPWIRSAIVCSAIGSEELIRTHSLLAGVRSADAPPKTEASSKLWGKTDIELATVLKSHMLSKDRKS
ncbi:alpha/beta hydrolase [uncultured Roseovarius sp.]|uniref:alpha/beta hydrolase n=1 Tax=uncultured Roseovarius sp. TaxID=293344 RepID=UPI00261A3666|nr:alpha/beta hydrolase [uncultured Roseovarius sp.]